MTQYLVAKELIAINTRILMTSNEVPFVRNPQGLDSIEHLPRQSFGGDDLYPTIEQKIGIVFVKLINLHCFEDANKRTAAIALQVLSALNGYELTFTNNELFKLTLYIAATDDPKLDYDKVYELIHQHLH